MGAIKTVDVIYQSASYGEKGSVSGADWGFVGAALSASTTKYFWQILRNAGANILYANATIVLNPNTTSNTIGVRLISFDDGVQNLVELHRWIYSNYTGPKPDGANITAQLQAMLANDTYKNIGFQTYGDGTNSPIIYMVRLEIIWD